MKYNNLVFQFEAGSIHMQHRAIVLLNGFNDFNQQMLIDHLNEVTKDITGMIACRLFVAPNGDYHFEVYPAQSNVLLSAESKRDYELRIKPRSK